MLLRRHHWWQPQELLEVAGIGFWRGIRVAL